MFFILSKTVSYLLMPFSLVLLCWLGSLVFKNPRTKKILFWSGMILLLFFSNGYVANLAMRSWEIGPTPFDEMKTYKLGLVLTGTTASVPYTKDRVYFHKGADRVTHTVQLYKLGLIEKILISGGSGKLTGQSQPEANQFRNAMLMMGVDTTAIMIENATRNTHESAIAVKPILDSLHYKAEECLLITSAFHMRRSLACYRKVGVELQPFTTDFYSNDPEVTLDAFIPSADAMILWQKLFREWIGMAAYKAMGYI